MEGVIAMPFYHPVLEKVLRGALRYLSKSVTGTGDRIFPIARRSAMTRWIEWRKSRLTEEIRA